MILKEKNRGRRDYKHYGLREAKADIVSDFLSYNIQNIKL